MKVLGLVTVQDMGRAGHMHEGLPHGGALVRELLVRANRAVRNPDGAAAIEVLGRMTIRAERAIEVATASRPEMLRPGEELTVESEPRRVAYLAVRGGVDAPLVLGGHGAHPSAGIGTLLRADARIAAGDAPEVARDIARETFDEDGTIRVIAGPDIFDLSVLASAPYKILSTSDRVGTRLDGPALAATAAEGSRPMTRGAIEVPRDGRPIVLGPEHPTTGGYPVIGVIAHADLDKFFAIRIGGWVRFVAIALLVLAAACKDKPEPDVVRTPAKPAEPTGSNKVSPEAGPHPDFPTPIAAGTDKIFSLEDPDRGPKPPLTFAVSTGGLAWTIHEHCESSSVGFSCGPAEARPKGLVHWRVGRKPGLIVTDRMIGTRRDARSVYTKDQTIEFDERDRVATTYRIGKDRYSARERDGGNALRGCGALAFKLDASKLLVESSCLQWLGEPMRDTQGVATVRYKRDANGLSIETLNLDLAGNPTLDRNGVARYLTTRDADGRRQDVRYRDANDRPVADITGCHGRHYEYHPSGAPLRTMCRDANDHVVTSFKGESTTRWEYDANGCRISEKYFAPDGTAVVDHDEVHGYLSSRNEYCDETSRTCIDRGEQPMSCGAGEPARREFKYDARGYQVSTKYFDTEGEPAKDETYDTHELRSTWNDRGNETKHSCWDAGGAKAECSTTGFHEQRLIYDDAGRETSSFYLDTHGKRTSNLGVFEHRYRYDNYDHLFEVKSFGEDGELADSMGQSIRRELYDASHRRFAILLYDKAAKPARYTGCFTGATCPDDKAWHAVRIVRRTDGSVEANTFFDADEQLIEKIECSGRPCFR